MNIYDVLKQLDMPVAYSSFKEIQTPPYLVYIGAGQSNYVCDDTIYYSNENYQIEYYFEKKNPLLEKAIEELLINNGYIYSKSGDNYLENDNLYVIYYQI